MVQPWWWCSQPWVPLACGSHCQLQSLEKGFWEAHWVEKDDPEWQPVPCGWGELTTVTRQKQRGLGHSPHRTAV